MKPVEVHKFGGTSLTDAACFVVAADTVRSASADATVAVVASAMAGVTDELIGAACEAAGGCLDRSLQRVDALTARHLGVLDHLQRAASGVPSCRFEAVREQLLGLLAEVAHLLQGVALVGELSSRVRDRVISVGEKLSVRLLALALELAHMRAKELDADTFLDTDDQFGSARPLAGVADRLIIKAVMGPVSEGYVPVVTGFCGRAPDGATTTLGRGGSDLTATLIAAAVGAARVTIWTDTAGVYSADPAVVPGARVIPQLNYREASELSFYGARVLHPRSIMPVASPEIPVHIRPVGQPKGTGTVIDGRFTGGSHPVKALSAVRGQCLLSVEGKGMAGVPGVAARMFAALAKQEISITMISQSSSEATICIALPLDLSDTAEAALKDEFRPDLTRGDVEEIVLVRSVGILAAVGLGMAQTPGVAARLFAALGARAINVRAIAQGSSELSISFAVDERRVDDALCAVHAEFQPAEAGGP